MKLEDLEFTMGSSQFSRAQFTFENGYGVSIVTGEYAYTSEDKPYELAVLRDGELCYDTPITNDVVGYCNEDMVNELLEKIEQLPEPIEEGKNEV